MISKANIEKVLKAIPDPEINVSIWDLGLIYDVKVDSKTGTVNLVMTLTTVGCPLFELIEAPVKKELSQIKGVKAVNIELTFDPPWSVDRMSKEAKEQLGFT